MAYYIPFLHARRNAGRQNRGSPSGRRNTEPREGQNQQQLVTEKLHLQQQKSKINHECDECSGLCVEHMYINIVTSPCLMRYCNMINSTGKKISISHILIY